MTLRRARTTSLESSYQIPSTWRSLVSHSGGHHARECTYGKKLKGDKATVEIRKTEAAWKAKIDDWDLFDTAKRETYRFIIGSVEYVWLAELKKKITIYAERTALELIEHLYKTCLDTHEIDVLDLQDQMREMHLKVDSIPEYIERMEKFQEQSERADNKIPDAMMVNISTKAVLSTERSPKTNNDWEDLSKTERTWPDWKTMYRDADNKTKVKKKGSRCSVWRADQQDIPYRAG